MNKKAKRAFAIEPLKHLLGCAVLALAMQQPASAVTLVLDHIHTVAAVGSTEPLGIFTVDGPPPVLFVDLPKASFLTVINSDWFHDVDPVASFQVQKSGVNLGDKLWLTPSAATWDAHKASGSWLVDTNIQLVDIVCVEAGCLGAPRDGGSTKVTVAFSVAGNVPEPHSGLLMAAGLAAMLGLIARRTR